MLASLAAASVSSLVRFAAAFRKAACELFMSMCITPKLPFLLSALPLSLLGTGFLTRPSVVWMEAPSGPSMTSEHCNKHIHPLKSRSIGPNEALRLRTMTRSADRR